MGPGLVATVRQHQHDALGRERGGEGGIAGEGGSAALPAMEEDRRRQRPLAVPAGRRQGEVAAARDHARLGARACRRARWEEATGEQGQGREAERSDRGDQSEGCGMAARRHRFLSLRPRGRGGDSAACRAAHPLRVAAMQCSAAYACAHGVMVVGPTRRVSRSRSSRCRRPAVVLAGAAALALSATSDMEVEVRAYLKLHRTRAIHRKLPLRDAQAVCRRRLSASRRSRSQPWSCSARWVSAAVQPPVASGTRSARRSSGRSAQRLAAWSCRRDAGRCDQAVRIGALRRNAPGDRAAPARSQAYVGRLRLQPYRCLPRASSSSWPMSPRRPPSARRSVRPSRTQQLRLSPSVDRLHHRLGDTMLRLPAIHLVFGFSKHRCLSALLIPPATGDIARLTALT